MMIYSHRKQRTLDVIDFREVAPAAINISDSAPGSYVGVPGVLKGMAVAHQLHGMLPWIDVVMPAVRIARYAKHFLFYVWLTVHLELYLYNEPTRCTVLLLK
jgi:gamma-glutamyltranspeptidase